jgi:hypothetical protein
MLVKHETGGAGKLISLAFQAYVDRSNPMSYVSCASIQRQGGPGFRVRLKVIL